MEILKIITEFIEELLKIKRDAKANPLLATQAEAIQFLMLARNFLNNSEIQSRKFFYFTFLHPVFEWVMEIILGVIFGLTLSPLFKWKKSLIAISITFLITAYLFINYSAVTLLTPLFIFYPIFFLLNIKDIIETILFILSDILNMVSLGYIYKKMIRNAYNQTLETKSLDLTEHPLLSYVSTVRLISLYGGTNDYEEFMNVFLENDTDSEATETLVKEYWEQDHKHKKFND